MKCVLPCVYTKVRLCDGIDKGGHVQTGKEPLCLALTMMAPLSLVSQIPDSLTKAT